MDNSNTPKNDNIVLKSIVSVDFGTLRVGLAAKPAGLTLCIPLDAVKTSLAEETILKLIPEKNVDFLVFGLPISADMKEGETSELALKIKNLARRIQKRANEIEVVFYDETLTSVVAQEMLDEVQSLKGKKISGSKRKQERQLGKIDSLAAVEILKAYLEER